MITKNINEVAQALKEGKIAAIPTETVYGLAGNALMEDAVLNIFKTKNRPFFDPLILHIDSPEKVHLYTRNIPDKALLLMKAFWPGPLTLVLPKKANVPDIVTSGLETVAIRVPSHPVTLKLLGQLDFPIAAPSANPFGYISPTSAADVEEQLGEKIPYILDGGIAEVGVESTIVGFEDGVPIVYRLGGIGIEKLEHVIGKVNIADNSGSENIKSPGMLKKHYAPRKAMYFGDIPTLLKKYKDKTCGLLLFQNTLSGYPEDLQIVLSPSGELEEASKQLFASMRKLDNMAVDLILAEPLPNAGLGRAINDRLFRASLETDEGLSREIYKR
ncbi:MAG: L-threonylcarbamoyladenylate synthase [Cytophagaceae bacterium]